MFLKFAHEGYTADFYLMIPLTDNLTNLREDEIVLDMTGNLDSGL